MDVGFAYEKKQKTWVCVREKEQKNGSLTRCLCAKRPRLKSQRSRCAGFLSKDVGLAYEKRKKKNGSLTNSVLDE